LASGELRASLEFHNGIVHGEIRLFSKRQPYVVITKKGERHKSLSPYI